MTKFTDCIDWNVWQTILKDSWNSLFNSLDTTNQITDDQAHQLIILIEKRFLSLSYLDTYYDEVEVAKYYFNTYFSSLAIPLVRELKATIESLNKDMGKQHIQSKFNDLDNGDVENASTKIDDTTFNWFDNYTSNITFFVENSRVLTRLYQTCKKDCKFIQGV